MRTFVELQLMGHITLHGWMRWEDRDKPTFDIEVWHEHYSDHVTGWREVCVGQSAVYAIWAMDMGAVIAWLGRKRSPPYGMEEAWQVACAYTEADDSARQQQRADDDVPF